MTDAALTVSFAPAGDVAAHDKWDGAAPALPGKLRVEPRRWWLFGAAAHDTDNEEELGERGALAPIGGGLVRATLDGPGWRALLMIGGCFDAEDPAFAAGCVAATVIHHVPVWIAPAGPATCHVYCAASYASTLRELWDRAVAAPAFTGAGA